MKSASLLRRSFRAGISLKGIDGVLEIAGGVALWFITPENLSNFVRDLLQHELSRDPHDFIAAHLYHQAHKLAVADPTFASIYLLSHGLVKIALVAALWANRLWAYPLTIGVFGAFCVYQVYRWTYTHSFTLAVLTIFDAVVIWLTWQEYGAQRTARARRISPAGAPQPAR